MVRFLRAHHWPGRAPKLRHFPQARLGRTACRSRTVLLRHCRLDALDGGRRPLRGQAVRPLRVGHHHRRRRRRLCAGHDRHGHHAQWRHADPGQRPGRRRPVGRLLRPGAGRDPARGAARQGGAGRRHLLGRRLVRPVLHRAAGLGAAELFRRLAADHVGADRARRADDAVADRAERQSTDCGRPQGPRWCADLARGAGRGVQPAQLRAAGDRLFRLRLPCRLRRRPSAGLYLRQGHRALAVRPQAFSGRAGRLEHRHGRVVQHRGLHPVELDGRRASSARTCSPCSICCARWCSWASSWRRYRQPRC